MSMRTIRFTLNGAQGLGRDRAAPQPGRVAAAVRPVRRARKLRPGPVRLLHGAGRWRGGVGLPLFRAWVDGKTVTTVEELDADGELSMVQQAFIDRGAFQCGFCTPGFVLMTHQLLSEIRTRATTTSATISPATSAAARPIRRSSRR